MYNLLNTIYRFIGLLFIAIAITFLFNKFDYDIFEKLKDKINKENYAVILGITAIVLVLLALLLNGERNIHKEVLPIEQVSKSNFKKISRDLHSKYQQQAKSKLAGRFYPLIWN